MWSQRSLWSWWGTGNWGWGWGPRPLYLQKEWLPFLAASTDLPQISTMSMCTCPLTFPFRKQPTPVIPRSYKYMKGLAWPLKEMLSTVLNPPQKPPSQHLLLTSQHAMPFSTQGRQNTSPKRQMGPFLLLRTFQHSPEAPRHWWTKTSQEDWKLTVWSLMTQAWAEECWLWWGQGIRDPAL